VDRILVVEDSRALQKALERLFRADSLDIELAPDGLVGLEAFRRALPAAVVLDLKLPGKSGRELCREFKAMAPQVPIVVLTADSDVDDKVLLLELGADDYVTKPFSPKELLARVRRAIRREQEQQRINLNAVAARPMRHETLDFSDVHVNFTTMEAFKDGVAVSMTAQEFKLLRYFAQSPGKVISRDELLNEVWGYSNYPSTRTVDNHVLRLRQKLESDAAFPNYFLTVHGSGYKFVPQGALGRVS
jgi:DNA-binding response OmpR family regulator